MAEWDKKPRIQDLWVKELLNLQSGPARDDRVMLSVLLVLATHMDNTTGETFISVRTLAAECRRSVRRVFAELEKADDKGFIRRNVGRGGRPTHYWPVVKPVQHVPPGGNKLVPSLVPPPTGTSFPQGRPELLNNSSKETEVSKNIPEDPTTDEWLAIPDEKLSPAERAVRVEYLRKAR